MYCLFLVLEVGKDDFLTTTRIRHSRLGGGAMLYSGGRKGGPLCRYLEGGTRPSGRNFICPPNTRIPQHPIGAVVSKL